MKLILIMLLLTGLAHAQGDVDPEEWEAIKAGSVSAGKVRQWPEQSLYVLVVVNTKQEFITIEKFYTQRECTDMGAEKLFEQDQYIGFGCVAEEGDVTIRD